MAERKPTVGVRVRALVLGLVPGLAHILVLDRTGVGTLLFVLFVLGADAALAGLYIIEDASASQVYLAGCVVAGGAWLASWLDMARIAVFRDYEKRAELRKRLTAEGVRHYAAGRHPQARASFRRCLDLDHRDPDVLFWYGCVQARMGKVGRARRAFRRCRKYDHEGRWTFHLGEQEARLAESGTGVGG